MARQSCLKKEKALKLRLSGRKSALIFDNEIKPKHPSPFASHHTCLLPFFSDFCFFFSIIRLSLISLLHTKALLQQGGTLGQKEAETEDQVGKKIDSDSENDQDSVCQVCRFLFHSLLISKARPTDSSLTFKGRTSLDKLRDKERPLRDLETHWGKKKKKLQRT